MRTFISFTDPTFGLLALIVACVGGIVVWQNQTVVRRLVLAVGEESMIPKFARAKSRFSPMMVALAWIVDLVLFVVTIAGPVNPYGKARVPAGDWQVIFAFDSSISMSAESDRADMRKWDPEKKLWIPGEMVQGEFGSRLDKAKELADDMLASLVNNQVGVLNYQGLIHGDVNALVRLYLSYDFKAAHSLLKSENWDWIGISKSAADDGSEVATVMNAACSAFDRAPEKDRKRTLIIFTDGGNDSSDDDMKKAYQNLKDHHVQVIFVALGKEGAGEHIPDYSQKNVA